MQWADISVGTQMLIILLCAVKTSPLPTNPHHKTEFSLEITWIDFRNPDLSFRESRWSGQWADRGGTMLIILLCAVISWPVLL